MLYSHELSSTLSGIQTWHLVIQSWDCQLLGQPAAFETYGKLTNV